MSNAMQRLVERTRVLVLASPLVLLGCAGFSSDGGMDFVVATAGSDINKQVVLLRTDEDAAAARELAVRIHRIRGFVAAKRERIGELVRIDVDAGLDLARGQQDRRRFRKLRQQRRRGRDHHASRVGRERVQRSRARPSTRGSTSSRSGRPMAASSSSARRGRTR